MARKKKVLDADIVVNGSIRAFGGLSETGLVRNMSRLVRNENRTTVVEADVVTVKEDLLIRPTYDDLPSYMPYVDYRFQKNTSLSTSPSFAANSDDPGALWLDSPPETSEGEYLWELRSDWIGTERQSEWVELRITGPVGESPYTVIIESSMGTAFKYEEAKMTTLTARVWRGPTEVTADLPSSAFKWTRVSKQTPNDDEAWNYNHSTGYKTIEVTIDGMEDFGTFFCEIST